MCAVIITQKTYTSLTQALRKPYTKLQTHSTLVALNERAIRAVKDVYMPVTFKALSLSRRVSRVLPSAAHQRAFSLHVLVVVAVKWSEQRQDTDRGRADDECDCENEKLPAIGDSAAAEAQQCLGSAL